MERVISNLKVRELEKIKINLQAFLGNVDGTLILQKSVNNIYITIDKDNKYNDIYKYINDIEFSDKYIYRVDNIYELNGWLYGVVQAKNNRV